MREHPTALEVYRAKNPRSRATRDWTYYGSTGCVRRATCIYCRRVIATCSQKWPETQQFSDDAEAHTCAEGKRYARAAKRLRFQGPPPAPLVLRQVTRNETREQEPTAGAQGFARERR